MFSAKTYQERRRSLKQAVGRGLILLPGNPPSPSNYAENCFPFRQDSSFLYFFGADRPQLAGLMDIDADSDLLFGVDASLDDMIWTGPTTALAELGQNAGVDRALPLSDLALHIRKAIKQDRPIHFLPPYRAAVCLELARLLEMTPQEIESGASTDLIRAVITLRAIKSEAEIEQIEAALGVAGEMFAQAFSMAAPGVTEKEVAGAMKAAAAAHGCRPSFGPIATMDGQVLHSEPRFIPLAKGRLMIIDSGAETALGYASDITRTLPVDERFDARQRDIYNIVLAANQHTVARLKPGLSYREAHLAAAATIAGGLIELGLMQGEVAEIVACGAHALFFPHGLGHLMGLDVHDMEALGEDRVGYGQEATRSPQFGLSALRFARKLKPGHVLTVEPGCYFIPPLIDKWRAANKFDHLIRYDRLENYLDFGGVRIEDNILVTETGCRVLGKPIPKTIAAVEAAMATK